jgi:hypothetical protein
MERVNLRASSSLLAPWKLGARVTANAYGGSLEGTASNLLSNPVISGALSALDLSQHRQLRALGVDSGLVDVQVSNHPLALPATMDASYSIEARGVSVEFPPLIVQLARIRGLSDLNLKGEGVLRQSGRFQIRPFEIQGSFGEASLAAHGLIQGNTVGELAGTLDVNLNGPDGENLKPWVGMLIRGDGEESAGTFHCAFRSGPCGTSAPMQVSLGELCILSSCSR